MADHDGGLLFELSELLFVSGLTPTDHAARVVTVRGELAAEILGWTAVKQITVAPILFSSFEYIFLFKKMSFYLNAILLFLRKRPRCSRE